MSGPYTIVALDANSDYLSETQEETLHEAREVMYYKIRDSELIGAGMRKVEVLNSDMEIISDDFVSRYR